MALKYKVRSGRIISRNARIDLFLKCGSIFPHFKLRIATTTKAEETRWKECPGSWLAGHGGVDPYSSQYVSPIIW